jgi:hypothetical protein
MKKLSYHTLLFVILATLFIGCSTLPTPEQRITNAKALVGDDALNKIYSTSYFNFYTYTSLPKRCINARTNIYIEGDGLAWRTSSSISDDPTPINPEALKMFLEDESSCKVYLARPCQYIQGLQCDEKYWTSHRFSKRVIDSYDELLTQIKSENKIKEFQLIGYSGGGAVAALVAARRDDVVSLITVAGNLDTDFWTKRHFITPLHGSLNPADFSDKLENIKQIHFIGEKDTIIDKSVFDSYASRFENKENIKYKIIEDFTHNCCWSDEWKSLLKASEKF